MKKSVQVFLACTLFSFSAFASTISQYQSAAVDQKLWENPYWNKLLHYEKTLFGGYVSQADGKDFFLSPSGKKNPKEELLKDIELLFDSEKIYSDPNDHPACKFPLRYTWLKQQLSLDVPDHAQLNCPDFHYWTERLGAAGATLVFASSYTNNPASMFGHTFLIIRRVQNGQELPSLLSYTVNFSAETGDETGMLYTIKGLFGAYPGYFSTFPYYIKIQQYNYQESRDLWEYSLNLRDEELKKIVFHLWELGKTYFDYYFVDENCSYFLLSLLEVSNDEVLLRKHLPFFTIPVGTLKITATHTNWFAGENYRPSLRRKYEKRFSLLNKNEKMKFDALLKTKNTDVLGADSPESNAKILDTMIDFQAMGQKQNTKTDFQKKLLEARSSIAIGTEEPTIDQPGNPIHGHPTIRLGLGDERIGGENFASVDFRSAYHDLLDDPEGFDPSAQIQGLEGRLRVSTKNGDVALDHLKLVEVVSLNPLEKYLSKPSWNVGFGWRKNFSDECFDCGALYVEGGPGITFGNSGINRIYFTIFGNLFVQAGPWNQTGYQIGPSGTSSLHIDVTSWIRLSMSGTTLYSPFGKPNFNYHGNFESAFEINKQLSLRPWFNLYSESHEYGGSLYYYF